MTGPVTADIRADAGTQGSAGAGASACRTGCEEER